MEGFEGSRSTQGTHRMLKLSELQEEKCQSLVFWAGIRWKTTALRSENVFFHKLYLVCSKLAVMQSLKDHQENIMKAVNTLCPVRLNCFGNCGIPGGKQSSAKFQWGNKKIGELEDESVFGTKEMLGQETTISVKRNAYESYKIAAKLNLKSGGSSSGDSGVENFQPCVAFLNSHFGTASEKISSEQLESH